jgi:hypothetical protein
MLTLTACNRQAETDYAFSITDVSVSRAYQSLSIRVQQELELSQQAREALEHGVMLTISLEMELRSSNNLIAIREATRYFQLRYLPLSERYQLSEESSDELETFSRLRHLLASVSDLNITLPTGPLPSGGYELRTRIRLDESRLPTPMQLPAWFSSQWQHDSEWSVWPFKISA